MSLIQFLESGLPCAEMKGTFYLKMEKEGRTAILIHEAKRKENLMKMDHFAEKVFILGRTIYSPHMGLTYGEEQDLRKYGYLFLMPESLKKKMREFFRDTFFDGRISKEEKEEAKRREISEKEIWDFFGNYQMDPHFLLERLSPDEQNLDLLLSTLEEEDLAEFFYEGELYTPQLLDKWEEELPHIFEDMIEACKKELAIRAFLEGNTPFAYIKRPKTFLENFRGIVSQSRLYYPDKLKVFVKGKEETPFYVEGKALYEELMNLFWKGFFRRKKVFGEEIFSPEDLFKIIRIEEKEKALFLPDLSILDKKKVKIQ